MDRTRLVGFDAVLLAGGKAGRLGGMDKAMLMIDGTRLVDRVIEAVREADRIVAVGPTRPTMGSVVWTREKPPGGGPVAALAAGLELVRTPRTLVVAVDLPLLDRDLVRDVVGACDENRAALAIDSSGRLQPLLACYPTERLRSAIHEAPPEGRSMMALVNSIDHVVVDDGGRSRDCDTWADLSEIRIGAER